MSNPVTIVAVSGSLHTPSRTSALAAGILDRFALALETADLAVETELIELSGIGGGFAGALTREGLAPEVEQALQRVERADLVVAASPVYRASFTGLFKHFFDFVGQYALIDTPVLLAATGGSERHALSLEHQFRPLFSFFQAVTLPLGVYARDTDFDGGRIVDPALEERVSQAVARGIPLVRAGLSGIPAGSLA
ncbi:FMN reductase [Agromyces archimandritae]|uniref:FMN reductase n=1 Tax=Agromyces archimandritae TaxID=2781962 RepID=A0A975IMY6_9MICO|nr:FMN reductase [Agromyces archimandritae]QTX03664.1 FMN reductase [Agromyces archimandritae]